LVESALITACNYIWCSCPIFCDEYANVGSPQDRERGSRSSAISEDFLPSAAPANSDRVASAQDSRAVSLVLSFLPSAWEFRAYELPEDNREVHLVFSVFFPHVFISLEHAS